MYSFTQLRVLVAVAETGSVGLAAEQLMVSQPAISAALSALSESCGAPVVEREGRGTRLTAAGEALAASGRRIFAMLDETQREIGERVAGGSRKLRLGAVTTFAEERIAATLRGFSSVEPETAIELQVGNRAQMWDRLRHWEIDLAIGGRPPNDPAFATLAMSPNELVVVCSPEHNRDYARAHWIVREPGSGTLEATLGFFSAIGLAPLRLTIGSNGAIRECVRAGLGMSLLSREGVARDVEDGTLVIVPTPASPLARNWHLVRAAGRELSKSAKAFLGYAIASGGFQALPSTSSG
jgi:LysR family transcriptional regulator, low CO2-responsive transcriptional regulator